MTLLVHTSQIRYRGPDRLDITRKSGGPAGLPFAPSWKILGPALDARHLAQRAAEAEKRALAASTDDASLAIPRARGALRKARVAEAEAWSAYVPAYLAEMAESKRRNFNEWRELLARSRVVLVCYCPGRERCHRGLLAKILVDLGAIDGGELDTATRTPPADDDVPDFELAEYGHERF